MSTVYSSYYATRLIRPLRLPAAVMMIRPGAVMTTVCSGGWQSRYPMNNSFIVKTILGLEWFYSQNGFNLKTILGLTLSFPQVMHNLSTGDMPCG